VSRKTLARVQASKASRYSPDAAAAKVLTAAEAAAAAAAAEKAALDAEIAALEAG
jgi:hypothetical protein